ncbi:hypothetical protein [Staphylococcus delphini]|uniref:Yip1 domain-containing protein n=2 Tax=Staphylococcus delphini TaxID=53344 RepID=A0AAX0QTM3_9STAP|nr:hypothetical protein [Staphylococcus delphini]PCF50271.1 hypothetical protein B5C07_07065 [Staphylococcus delphini]RIZ55540.1 hypothetical protein CDL68_02275 [Staphylococcus delphini]VED61981.1 Uncharacterised protein [Staphylococcus delphini]
MKTNHLIFGDYFETVANKKRWGLKLLMVLTIVLLSSILTVSMMDFTELNKSTDLNASEENSVVLFAKIFIIFISLFTVLFSIVFHYFFFLILARLTHNKLKPLSIISLTISMQLVIVLLSLIGIVFQFVFDISIEDYNLLSLNIFDKGNSFLGNINFTLFMQSYLVFVILFKNIEMSAKTCIFISSVYLLTNIIISSL